MFWSAEVHARPARADAGATNDDHGDLSLMGLEKTPSRKFRDKLARDKYERRAKRKSGPVVTRFVCPLCGGAHARKNCKTT